MIKVTDHRIPPMEGDVLVHWGQFVPSRDRVQRYRSKNRDAARNADAIRAILDRVEGATDSSLYWQAIKDIGDIVR